MESDSNEKSTINNKYNIIEKKGKGASCKVYLVENQNDKNKYAAKVLNEMNDTFLKEIHILENLSKLNSPLLVNLIEFGEGPIKIESKPVENKQYLILDYASKGEIFDYLADTGRGLSEKHAKYIFKKILESVQLCHTHGICHRDLKMQNILLDETFNPKLCDFGFATEIKGEDGSGKLKDYLGTPNYAAPEIFLHSPYSGVKADIFSLGVILINLVTGKIGFVQATRRDKYYKFIILKRFPAYWNLVGGMIGNTSEGFKSLYQKMISFKPEERPSIEEILKDPWMNEINALNENELKELEKEVFADFKEREQAVIDNNESVNAMSSEDINSEGFRSVTEDGKEYFNLDLKPNYYQKTGFNMNNYMKINGELNPAKFMNNLANKINSEFKNKCTIEANPQKLKFNVTFETEEEGEDEDEEKNEEDKEIEEELNKLNIQDIDEAIEGKDSVIQVKMLQSMNEGYLVRFEKRGGEIEDYHKNLKNIVSIIKKIV